MISQKLKTLFFISIPIFVAHGLEEYSNAFYNIDSHSNFMLGYFNNLPTPQATFLLFQIMLWFVLIISAFLISGEKWQLRLMIIPGLVYIYELHHFWKAFEVWGYYPGIITATVFPIIGFLFWKELLNNFKNHE